VLHLNGTLKQIDGWGKLSSLSDEFSRLRLYAAGRLSDQLPGHLAIAEPEENGDWSARASSAQDRVQWPLVLPVEAELRGNDRRVGKIFVIPGGIAIGSGLRIWSSTDEGEGTLPDQLQLHGTGSGGFRSDSLWLDVPLDWTVLAPDENHSPELAHGDDQRRIWKVAGQAHVCTPQGDIFSVRPGQKSDTKDLLRLVGDTSYGIKAVDCEMSAFRGWPQAFVSEKGKDRAPQRGEIWWRPNGQREWQHLGLGQPFGATEFAWRDQSSGHLRAKAEAIILPEAFELNQERTSDRVFLRSSEWGGAISLPGHRQDQSGRWIISIDRPSSAHVEIKLEMAGRESISLRYAIPMRAWIGKWTDGLCDTDSQIALTELHRHVARTEYATDLMADLFDGSGKYLPQGQTEWEVSGELGMATLHDDVSALIGPAGIDAKVKLNFNDGHENYWFVTQFVNELVREPGYGLMPSKAIIDEDVRVFGRFLGRPEKVEDLGQYTWLTNARQRVDLPVLFGPWLIYLTKDGNALTRPFLLKGKELVIAPDTILGRAMVSEAAERAELLQTIISDCVADPSGEVGQPLLRSMVALASALDDLPPLTFEIFGLLAKHSELMVELVFACQSAAEIERVMQLERGLPFSWACAPVESWNAAFQRLCSQLFGAFLDIYQNPEIAISKTKEAAREFVQPVIDFEAALEVHFSPPDLVNRVSEIVGSFLDRSGDRIGKERLANPFRPSHEDALHDWPGALHYRRAIDAPIVAAKAAKSRAELSAGQIACIKEIARRHPRYFSECYAASIRE
jgi:hypothetical protein